MTAPYAPPERAFARIDPYPYRHRIADVMSAPPKFVGADVSLADALQRMAREKISSLLVAPVGSGARVRAKDTAIVTERDVLRAFVRARAPPRSRGRSRNSPTSR